MNILIIHTIRFTYPRFKYVQNSILESLTSYFQFFFEWFFIVQSGIIVLFLRSQKITCPLRFHPQITIAYLQLKTIFDTILSHNYIYKLKNYRVEYKELQFCGQSKRKCYKRKMVSPDIRFWLISCRYYGRTKRKVK